MPHPLFRVAASLAAAVALAVPGVAHAAGYPQQNVLPVWPDNPSDGSAAIGDIPYDEIAPKLNALQAASNRVSARVAGTSSGGHDLYVVVVTAPETAEQATQQDTWRQLIEDDPARARTDPDLLAKYKTPLFVNANIHGNEKEGTDASLRVIEQLATSTAAADEQLLQRNRLVFNITSNPDGRVANTRGNAGGYDLNRDLTIASQPEARLIRDLIVQTRPIITLDLHGYTPPTLIHPSTPPHNVNDEYDLYIKHAYPNALGIEQGLIALGYPEVPRARIPFRDDAPGVWDDFPPIYVPSFALLNSSISYTIEAPLSPGSGSTAVRRADIDTDVHEVAIRTSLKYIQDHRDELIFDQAEVYRRGWAGEPLRDIPDGFVPGWGPEDKYTTTFPRSYVIPAGARQHSAPAAKRLVDLLIASGGRVTQAKAAFTAGGNSYPAGSYVIDLHQPKRGIVNSLLEPGIDLTDRVNDLYAGPAAWSQGITWGATVDTLTTELPNVATDRVFSGVAEGQVAAGTGDLVIDPQDAEDLLAINALLAQGVRLTRLSDGSLLVPSSGRAAAATQAAAHGVTFKAAPSGWTGVPLHRLVIAYNGGSEVKDTLTALGFESRAVTATTLTTTLTSDVDVLLVGATLNPATLNTANRAAYDAFVTRGGGIVGLGTAGAAFTSNGQLLTVTGTAAASLASGVANFVNAGGPVINGAGNRQFINQPVWYSNLDANAVVEQSYAAEPLLAGWWPRTGTQGRSSAAGKASIVHALAPKGNGLVLIGTTPVFRLHPKGLQPVLGRAILWAAAPAATTTVTEGGAAGTVPATLAVTLGAPATFGPFTPGVAKEYTASTTANIISTAGEATLSVADPSSTATGHLVNGTFALPQPLQGLGVVRTWSAPTSNEPVPVTFKQSIATTDALRTGTYSKTLAFTLSTTTP